MIFDLSSLWDILLNIFDAFVENGLKFLPVSPVVSYLSVVTSLPYLGYINWFCPIGPCVTIMSWWVSCVAGYYLVSVVLRWIKIIQ